MRPGEAFEVAHLWATGRVATGVEPTSSDRVDHVRLSSLLKALANPVRLEILERLRFPKKAAEIRISPQRAEGGLAVDRPMSRQAVDQHLDVLEAIGVVKQADAGDVHGDLPTYVLDQQEIFSVIEELRRLTKLRSVIVTDPGATRSAEPQPALTWARGPKLVLASGPWEGKVFQVTPDGPCVLGRAKDVHVRLDYDPFVSGAHAEIAPDEHGSWRVRDLEGSKNGSLLNFVALPKGAWTRLGTGDILSVGRSLLVFRSE